MKRYEAEILTVLASFERAKDWADLSTCLGRLQKALAKAPTKVSSIPFSDVIAKRLGQCLNPTFPAGLHSNCLEVYRCIFSQLETQQLALQLSLWTPGLFSIFRHAAISVLSAFLDLIEEFFIPLGERLKPCLTGLVVSLLPGIDTTGGEVHTRVMKLFYLISHDCVGISAFMFSLWVVLNRTTHVRLAALQVLVEFLPDHHLSNLSQDALDVYLPNTSYDLILGTFERLLSDPDVLVQRQFFDFIVLNLPLNSSYFTLRDHKIPLLQASFHVIRVPEWSLERRFLQWITGQSNVHDEVNISFFETYVLDSFCTAIQNELYKDQGCLKGVKPCFPFNLLHLLKNNVPQLLPVFLKKIIIPLWIHGLKLAGDRREAFLSSLREIFVGNPVFLESAWMALYANVEMNSTESCLNVCVVEALGLFFYFWWDQYVEGNHNEAEWYSLEKVLRMSEENESKSLIEISLQRKESLDPSCFAHLQYMIAQCLRNHVLLLELSEFPREHEQKLIHLTLQSLFLFSTCSPIEISLNQILNESIVYFLEHVSQSMLILSRHHAKEISNCCCKSFNAVLVALLRLCRSFFAKYDSAEYMEIFRAVQDGCAEIVVRCVKEICSGTPPDRHTLELCVSLFSEQENLWYDKANLRVPCTSVLAELISGIWDHLLDFNSGDTGCTLEVNYHRVQDLLLLMNDLECKAIRTKDSTLLRLLISQLSSLSFEIRMGSYRKFMLLWNQAALFGPSYCVQKKVWLLHELLSFVRLKRVGVIHYARETMLRCVSRSWFNSACTTFLSYMVDPLFEELIILGLAKSSTAFDTDRVLYLLSLLSSVLFVQSTCALSAMFSQCVSDHLLTEYWRYVQFEVQGVQSRTLTEESLENLCLGVWGYDDSGVVVDYVDLSCVIVLHLIHNDSVNHGQLETAHMALRSATVEFFLRLLTALEASAQTESQNEKVYCLLAPSLFRLLFISLCRPDSCFQIQMTELLEIVLKHLCPLVTKLNKNVVDPLVSTFLVQLNGTHHEDTGDLEYVRTTSLSRKTAQFCLLPYVLRQSSKMFLSLAESMLRLIVSTAKGSSYESVRTLLDSLFHFTLLVLRHISTSQPQVLECQKQAISLFVNCLIQKDFCEGLLGLWYILGGLSHYILFLGDPFLDCTVKLKESTDANSSWASVFTFNWFSTSLVQGTDEVESQLYSSRDLLKSSTLSVVGALITVQQRVEASYGTWERFSNVERIVRESLEVARCDNVKQLSKKALPSLNAFSSYREGVDLLYTQILITFVSLLKRCPEGTCVALLALLQMPKYSEGVFCFLSLIVASDFLGPLCVKTIVGVFHSGLLLCSAQNEPSSIPETIVSTLSKRFFVSEISVLSVFYFLLSHCPEPSSKISPQEWQTTTFALLDIVMNHSSKALSFIWMMIILCELDRRFPLPSRLVESRVDGKRIQRQLCEIVRILSAIASQQYAKDTFSDKLEYSLLPPPCLNLIFHLFRYPSCSVMEFQRVDVQKSFFNLGDFKTYLGECAPVVQGALFASAVLVECNLWIQKTQDVTFFTGCVLKSFCKKYWLALFKSLHCISPCRQVLDASYLGWVVLASLPVSYYEVCSIPCKKITFDVVHGIGHDQSSFVSQVLSNCQSPGMRYSNIQGIHVRRCFRALTQLVQNAIEVDVESVLGYGNLLTMARSSGFFSFRDTELMKKAEDLKRLSLMLLSSPTDFYKTFVVSIAARITESLHLDTQHDQRHELAHVLKIQAFLCFRVLCLRMSSKLLHTLWPIVLTELIRTFSLDMNATNFAIFLSVLKVVDIAILLDIPEFHTHQWIFVRDGCETITPNFSSSEETTEKKEPFFLPICNDLAERHSEMLGIPCRTMIEEAVFKKDSGTVSRRPLVTESSVHSVEHLRSIAMRLSQNALRNYLSSSSIDEDAVLRSIEDDLFNIESTNSNQLDTP